MGTSASSLSPSSVSARGGSSTRSASGIKGAEDEGGGGGGGWVDGFADVVHEELSRVKVDYVSVDLRGFRLKDFTWRSNASLCLHVQVGGKFVGGSDAGVQQAKAAYMWDRFCPGSKIAGAAAVRGGYNSDATADDATDGRSAYNVGVNIFIVRVERTGQKNAKNHKRKRVVLGYVSIPLLHMVAGPELYDHAVFGCKYPEYKPREPIDLGLVSPRPSARKRLGRLTFSASVKIYTEWAIQMQALICEFPSHPRTTAERSSAQVVAKTTMSMASPSHKSRGHDNAGSPLNPGSRGSARMRRSIDPQMAISVSSTLGVQASSRFQDGSGEFSDESIASSQKAEAGSARDNNARAGSTAMSGHHRRNSSGGGIGAISLSPSLRPRQDVEEIEQISLHSSPQTDRSSFAALPSASHDDSSGWANYLYRIRYSLVEHGDSSVTVESSEASVEAETDATGVTTEAVLWQHSLPPSGSSQESDSLDADASVNGDGSSRLNLESALAASATPPPLSRRRVGSSAISEFVSNPAMAGSHFGRSGESANLPVITQVGSFLDLSQLGSLRFELLRRSRSEPEGAETLVASSSISFERLLSLAQDIVVRENSFGNQEASPEGGPRRSRKDGVTIVCAAELPLHFDGVEQCVLGIRVALGNVPRLCQTSEGVYTEFGIQSVLVLHGEPRLSGGEHPSVRGLRDVTRMVAKIKDQRSKPRAVHEAFEQMRNLLLSSGCVFEYGANEWENVLVTVHCYPRGFKPFDYGNNLAVLQATQQTLLDVWEVVLHMINPQMRLVTRNIAFEVLHLLILRPELGAHTFLLTESQLPAESLPKTAGRGLGDELSESTKDIVRSFYTLMARTVKKVLGLFHQGIVFLSRERSIFCCRVLVMAFFRFPDFGECMCEILLPSHERSIVRWQAISVRQPGFAGAPPPPPPQAVASGTTGAGEANSVSQISQNAAAGSDMRLNVSEWRNTDFDLDDTINVTRRTSSSLLLLSGTSLNEGSDSDSNNRAGGGNDRKRSRTGSFLQLCDHFDWKRPYAAFVDILEDEFDDPRRIRLPLLDPDTPQYTRLTRQFQKYQTLFFLFGIHYMEYVSETIAATTFRHRRRLLLHSIKGYQKILKVLLIEMKVRDLADYPERMIHLSRGMLLDASNLGVFLRIVLRKCNIHDVQAVAALLECLDCWFEELGRPKLRVDPKLDHVCDMDTLLEAIRILLGNGATPAHPGAPVHAAASSSAASSANATPAKDSPMALSGASAGHVDPAKRRFQGQQAQFLGVRSESDPLYLNPSIHRNSQILCKMLQWLYKHLPVLGPHYGSRVRNILREPDHEFGSCFSRLMLHWSVATRKFFHHVLIFRLMRPSITYQVDSSGGFEPGGPMAGALWLELQMIKSCCSALTQLVSTATSQLRTSAPVTPASAPTVSLSTASPAGVTPTNTPAPSRSRSGSSSSIASAGSSGPKETNGDRSRSNSKSPNALNVTTNAGKGFSAALDEHAEGLIASLSVSTTPTTAMLANVTNLDVPFPHLESFVRVTLEGVKAALRMLDYAPPPGVSPQWNTPPVVNFHPSALHGPYTMKSVAELDALLQTEEARRPLGLSLMAEFTAQGDRPPEQDNGVEPPESRPLDKFKRCITGDLPELTWQTLVCQDGKVHKISSVKEIW